MYFPDLVGARLIEVDNNGFKVIQDGHRYSFEYVSDEGYYGGYNNIASSFLIEDDKEEYNPIITKISYTIDTDKWSQKCEITFFGLSRPIYKAAIESSSDNGWYYGATVKLVCKEKDINEVLTSW